MKNIDPTYLRFVHDGLQFGTLKKDNTSALPIGLIGMYEAAMPPQSNVNERKRFLEFFGVWALMKMEVSAGFVSEVLGWSEEEVFEYLGRYSKWFNSLVARKYTLYHERFRLFIIQKISRTHLISYNAEVIQHSQVALERKEGSEWELYALEYLSNHLFLSAMYTGKSDLLKELAYNTSHWSRQLEISKGFEWSKKMLNDVMQWAAKYDDQEVIECALNKVDLHHMEQNDAPRIIELVANNNIETALQRIEFFGGNDKEGLQRKFILYMLCLMELTLLGSKDKPFRKIAIEKLLRHLDDSVPMEYSVLNWNDFFDSYLMFQISFEISSLNLDISILYKRSENWELNWINEAKLLSKHQTDFLIQLIQFNNSKKYKSKLLNFISIHLACRGDIESAIQFANDISNKALRDDAVKNISCQSAKTGNVSLSFFLVDEISDNLEKNFTLLSIALIIGQQGDVDGMNELLLGVISFAKNIKDDQKRDDTIKNIVNQLALCKFWDIAFELTNKILDIKCKHDAKLDLAKNLYEASELEKSVIYLREIKELAKEIKEFTFASLSLIDISRLFFKNGKSNEAYETLEQALSHCENIISPLEKYRTQIKIATEFNSQAFWEKSNLLISSVVVRLNSIDDEIERCRLLKEISFELSLQSKEQESDGLLTQALDIAVSVSNYWDRNILIDEIVRELLRKDNWERAIKITFLIGDLWAKNIIQKIIFNDLSKKGNLNAVLESIIYSFVFDHSIENIYDKNELHRFINKCQIQKENYFIAINSTSLIKDTFLKNHALNEISNELLLKGMFKQSLETASMIENDYEKCLQFIAIYGFLWRQNKIEEASKLLENTIVLALNLKKKFYKILALIFISNEHLNCTRESDALNTTELALNSVSDLNDPFDKFLSLKVISRQYRKLGQNQKSSHVMLMALESINSLKDYKGKIDASIQISQEFIVENKYTQALSIVENAFNDLENINDDNNRIDLLIDISKTFAKLKRWDRFENTINCAVKIAENLDNSFDNPQLKKISLEFARLGKWSQCENTVNKIKQFGSRIECWQKIGELIFKKNGYLNSIRLKEKFSSIEANKFCKIGMINSVRLSNITSDTSIAMIKDLLNDIDLINYILQLFVLKKILNDEIDIQKVEVYNKKLNIQWALNLRDSILYNGNNDQIFNKTGQLGIKNIIKRFNKGF